MSQRVRLFISLLQMQLRWIPNNNLFVYKTFLLNVLSWFILFSSWKMSRRMEFRYYVCMAAVCVLFDGIVRSANLTWLAARPVQVFGWFIFFFNSNGPARLSVDLLTIITKSTALVRTGCFLHRWMNITVFGMGSLRSSSRLDKEMVDFFFF